MMEAFFDVLSKVLVGVLFGGIVLGVAKVSRALIGIWYSPLTLFVLRWLLVIFLYLLNFAGYDAIRPLTWIVLVWSMGAFAIGSLIPMLSASRRAVPLEIPDVAAALREVIDKRNFTKAINLLFFLGVLVLLLYLYSIEGSYGISVLVFTPYIVRANIAIGRVPLGFQYFYLMETVTALIFLYIYLYRRKTPRLLILLGGFAAASLVLTTGKVNLVKLVGWCIFLLLYLNLNRLTAARASALAVVTLLLGFGLFVVLSTWGGEEFENTLWYQYVPVSGHVGNLLYAYIYNTGQIPTLDNLLHDSGVEFQWGKLTFLPIAKLIGIVIPEFTVPSHIGTFYPIPFPFNVATYLDVMYKDFGLFGTLLLPFVLGWLTSAMFVRFLRTPCSFWLFYLNTILALWVNASVSAAGYLKPVYWFQIGVGYILARYITRTTPQRATIAKMRHQRLSVASHNRQ